MGTRPLLAALFLGASGLGGLALRAQAPEARWYRGNTHTHTLWSDGDGAPELVVEGYVRAGYDFLVLSDHNLMQQGERWFPVAREGDLEQRLTPARLAALRERFGEESLEVRTVGERSELRLATLPELEARFGRPGEFLLVPGEEVSGSFERRPLHVNALNLVEPVYPPSGETLSATLNGILEAVAEQGRREGRPVLAHVNHPNFGWAIGWRELAAIGADRFFEVYNGHPAVHNAGDGEHLSLEQMWDLALHLRLTELDLGLLYGVATDDTHNVHETGLGRSNMERGWIVVRAPRLEADALIEAMGRGDFYASSGVELLDVEADDEGLALEVRREEGVTYTVRFVGTRRGAGPEQVGEVLSEVVLRPGSGPPPAPGARVRYSFHGDELYVRAVVVSDRPHPNPCAEGDLESAWVQPVRP